VKDGCGCSDCHCGGFAHGRSDANAAGTVMHAPFRPARAARRIGRWKQCSADRIVTAFRPAAPSRSSSTGRVAVAGAGARPSRSPRNPGAWASRPRRPGRHAPRPEPDHPTGSGQSLKEPDPEPVDRAARRREKGAPGNTGFHIASVRSGAVRWDWALNCTAPSQERVALDRTRPEPDRGHAIARGGRECARRRAAGTPLA
jgi:hypothetical protein